MDKSQKFKKWITGIFITAGVALTAALASTLGSNTHIKGNNLPDLDDPDNDDCDEDGNIVDGEGEYIDGV